MESIKICRNCEEPNPSENEICEKCNEGLPDEVYFLYPESNERKVDWSLNYLSKYEKAKRFSSA